jgi:hypothetical protein
MRLAARVGLLRMTNLGMARPFLWGADGQRVLRSRQRGCSWGSPTVMPELLSVMWTEF